MGCWRFYSCSVYICGIILTLMNKARSIFVTAARLRCINQYKKTGTAWLRPAEPGEIIETRVGGQLETLSQARSDSFVVRANTKDQEQYIISGARARERYNLSNLDSSSPGNQAFVECEAIGTVWAYQYSGDTFTFQAPWGEQMIVNDGDFLCSPSLDSFDDVYRIEQNAFYETYRSA